MTREKRWLNWRWEPRNKAWTKVPYNPSTSSSNPNILEKGDSGNPETWDGYPKAAVNVKKGRADGIGFALLGSGIGAVDLDKCCERDAATGEVKIDQWAQELCEEAKGAYCEVTVSGTGLRLIGKTVGGELQRRFKITNQRPGAGIELFRNAVRYITVSGLEQGECEELPPIDDFLDRLLARCENNREKASEPNHHEMMGPIDYDEVLKHGVPEGDDRSATFHSVVWHFAATGLSVEDIEAKMRKYPEGIASKYLQPTDRLNEEVVRSYEKWQQAAGSMSVADFDSLPCGSFLCRVTRETWSPTVINARVRSPVKDVSTTAWLLRHGGVDQMTWAPGDWSSASRLSNTKQA